MRIDVQVVGKGKEKSWRKRKDHNIIEEGKIAGTAEKSIQSSEKKRERVERVHGKTKEERTEINILRPRKKRKSLWPLVEHLPFKYFISSFRLPIRPVHSAQSPPFFFFSFPRTLILYILDFDAVLLIGKERAVLGVGVIVEWVSSYGWIVFATLSLGVGDMSLKTGLPLKSV